MKERIVGSVGEREGGRLNVKVWGRGETTEGGSLPERKAADREAWIQDICQNLGIPNQVGH